VLARKTRKGKDMPNERQILSAVLLRSTVICVVFFILLGVAMFLPAGDIRWAKGWSFLLVFLVLVVLIIAYLWRTNPDIIVARSRIHKGTKGWDKKVFMAPLLLSLMAIFLVAAFDDGRFHWSSVPFWAIVLGYVLLCVGLFIGVWAEKVNKFAEPGVRIQTERGHTVVDTGPYGIVRHPMYASTVFTAGGIALALGSYWALVPAAITILVLVPRTMMEDRTLHDELDGYKEYAGRVRYRLFPGIW
jgi:protein-S-isoprenylcysteine O-methyltransferase Ste14